ncbi:hypothetical protein C8J56DRAFT_881681 [Mycena floridula]|nr:hypothetical protein C8J56DRAFT_881681 [Mycena floridula]
MPKGLSTKGKSKAADHATPVGGQLSGAFQLAELENVVPQGPVRRSRRGQGDSQPLADFNPAEYTDRSPGGRQHKGVLYRLPPGLVPQVVFPSSQPAVSAPFPPSSSILLPKLRQPADQSREPRKGPAPLSSGSAVARPKRKLSIPTAQSDFSSNAAVPGPLLTKPVPSSSSNPSSLEPELDSLEGEQFDLGEEDLRNLPEDTPSKAPGWDQSSCQDDQEEGATGSDGVSVDEVPRIDIKTYLARKRTLSDSQPSPGPSRATKQGKSSLVTSSLAPDVSQDIDRDLAALFGQASSLPLAQQTKPLKSALKPQRQQQSHWSSREKDQIIIRHKGDEIAPEAMDDWNSRVKVVTADGRTMAVDKDTYAAFQHLISMAANEVAAGKAVDLGLARPESHNRDQARTTNQWSPLVAAEVHVLDPQSAGTCELARTHLAKIPSVVIEVLVHGLQVAGQIRKPRTSLVVVRQTAGPVSRRRDQVVGTPETLGRVRALAQLLDTGIRSRRIGPATDLLLATVIALLPPGTVVDGEGAGLVQGIVVHIPEIDLAAGIILVRGITVALTLGRETEIIAALVLVRIPTLARDPVITPGRVPETMVVAIPDLSREVAGQIPGIAIKSGLYGAGSLAALTSKAVKAAKDKAFAKPAAFQIDKESGNVIQSVRMVDNSGDKDMSVLDFLEASNLFVKAIRRFFIPQGRTRTGTSVALDTADEYQKIFDFLKSRNDLRENWPAYKEYLTTAIVIDKHRMGAY